MSIRCSICGEHKEESDFHFRKDTGKYYKHCKECHRKMVNKNYNENREAYLLKKKEYHSNHTNVLTRAARKYYNKNPEKMRAHNKINRLIYAGKIIKPDSCQICGSKGRGKKSKIHAHHYDYSKPLDVIWVCAKCHKAIHMGKLEARNEQCV